MIFTKEENIALDLNLKAKQALEIVDLFVTETDQFLNTLFTRPKKMGEYGQCSIKKR